MSVILTVSVALLKPVTAENIGKKQNIFLINNSSIICVFVTLMDFVRETKFLTFLLLFIDV